MARHAGEGWVAGIVAGAWYQEAAGAGEAGTRRVAAGMECTRCVERVDHCHGTLIMHVSGEFECTDTECHDVDQARHPLVIDCATVEGGCACAPELIGPADDTAPAKDEADDDEAEDTASAEDTEAGRADAAELLAVG